MNRFIRPWWQTERDTAPHLEDGGDYDPDKPTRLLFQTTNLTHPFVRFECTVVRKSVKSKVACSKATDSSRHDCEVIAQQAGSLAETYSILNILTEFSVISGLLPRVAVPDLSASGGCILAYLYDSTDSWSTDMSRTSARDFGRRLSQVLNSYVLLNRASFTINPSEAGAEKVDILPDQLQPWGTTYAQLDDYMYSISISWMTACLSSCLVLFISGVLGVHFTHLHRGPRLLVLVSTALRDSRYFDIPALYDTLDSYELSALLKRQRIRHGVVRQSECEEKACTADGRLGIMCEGDIRGAEYLHYCKADPAEEASVFLSREK